MLLSDQEHRFAEVMVPVGIVSVLASLAVLLAYFRRSIPKTYDVAALRSPADAISDQLTFRTGWVVLALLLIGYFGADPVGVPLSVVAGAGAVILVAVAARRPAFVFAQAARQPVPGDIIIIPPCSGCRCKASSV
jgi:arsenical pump membrane protein